MRYSRKGSAKNGKLLRDSMTPDTDICTEKKSKNSKQAAASAQAAREALLQFGPVPTQARQLLVTACIALFDSSTAAVRAEALSLSRQLLLVLGTSIRPLFDSLRPIQVCLHACLPACLPQWQ